VLGVTLDTNIYVSALEFGGVGARLLGMKAQPISVPPKVVAQHRQEFIQNRIRDVDAEHSGASASGLDRASRDHSPPRR
jgi:hypothetical protein